MFKEYLIPYDPPPPFDPEVGFSPKLDKIRKLFRNFNMLSPLEMRLDRDGLIERLILDQHDWEELAKVFVVYHPYLECIVRAQNGMFLKDVQLYSFRDSSLRVRAEYMELNFTKR